MVENILLVIQIAVSVGLVVVVLLQQKGSGVGSAFGGEATMYRSRRGVEKILHYVTIVAAIVLGLTSLVSVLYSLKF